jgi:hypothetical protein
MINSAIEWRPYANAPNDEHYPARKLRRWIVKAKSVGYFELWVGQIGRSIEYELKEKQLWMGHSALCGQTGLLSRLFGTDRRTERPRQRNCCRRQITFVVSSRGRPANNLPFSSHHE